MGGIVIFFQTLVVGRFFFFWKKSGELIASRFFSFNFYLFTILTSFLIFRKKNILTKLWVFLKVKKKITNFLNPLNI